MMNGIILFKKTIHPKMGTQRKQFLHKQCKSMGSKTTLNPIYIYIYTTGQKFGIIQIFNAFVNKYLMLTKDAFTCSKIE